jgi:hypothetical protein
MRGYNNGVILRVAYGDALDVYTSTDPDAYAIGAIHPSVGPEQHPSGASQWWAAHRCNAYGRIIEQRIGTYPTLQLAVEALI